jgi:hypothetical protein
MLEGSGDWWPAMKFSEHVGIARVKGSDWFDLDVNTDTPLYVDPFLIYRETVGRWAKAHEKIVTFFQLAVSYLDLANGVTTSVHWSKAERLFSFPEPKEFALGLSMGHPEGSGVGPDTASSMVLALDRYRHSARTPEQIMGIFQVVVAGMGVDRISDMICNILKADFIRYTEKVCRKQHIPTEDVLVRHADWDELGVWHDLTCHLPASPMFRGGLLLVPKRFLKEIPRVTPDGFWHWSEINRNEELRFQFNYDLSQNLSRAEKTRRARELAERSPDILVEYIDAAIGQGDLESYNVDDDPDLLVGWNDAGDAFAHRMAPVTPIQSQEDFERWLTDLVNSFKYEVENSDLWRVFWNEPINGNYVTHRQEKIVQAVARVAWVHQCKAEDIDMSREADVGRGPVDFKFSRGWRLRGLLEVKHISNSKFFHGVSEQLPVYLRAEQIQYGIFLCVGYSDRDFDEDRLERVQEHCRVLEASQGLRVTPIFVDARPKPPGSRV